MNFIIDNNFTDIIPPKSPHESVAFNSTALIAMDNTKMLFFYS